ncbi:P1 family peptidase, partial [Corynebacterium sp. 11254D000AR]
SQGSVGAGCGATAGKLRGGVGRAQLAAADTGFRVGAIVVANPVGQVVDAATGRLFGAPGRPGIDRAAFAELPDPAASLNTTIGVVYTDAPLNKAQAQRLALAGHDGIARAVRPAHSPLDGDTLFGVSTATPAQAAGASAPVGDATLARLTALAADAVEAAIVSAVCAASDGFGYPAYSSLLR